MITYVNNTSTWEDWQRAYRLGIILILPPPEVSEEINRLRARYDPRSAVWCPALACEIRGVLSDVRPFKLQYDRLCASTRHPGVAYRISPREPVDRLKDVLHGTSGFAGEVYRRRHIAPHMTIAEFISVEESLQLCARLQDTAPAGRFLCDRLEYMVPDERFRFNRRMTFSLGDSA